MADTPTTPESGTLPAGSLKPDAGAADPSLVTRLTRLNLLVLSLTLVLSFGLIATSSWLAARERQARAAELGAEQLANSLAPMLVFDDRHALQADLVAFSRRSDLIEVQVLAADGQAFGGWLAPGQPAMVPARPEQGLSELRLVSRTGLSELSVWAPIKLKGETVGALRLRESLQSLQRTVWRVMALASLLILLAIVLASRVLRLVQRRALAPLVELTALAEQVGADQDYSRRVPVRRRDEVGRLSERFNQMLKRIEAAQADLNQRLRQEQVAGQQFQQLAHSDSLTQLPNRLYFQEELQRQLGDNLQRQALMALMFIDLDNFKAVNDGHGHDAGDAVLREVSARMARVLRSTDVLCRLGGDEFALILPGLTEESVAEQLAGRLIAAVREPLLIGGQVMPVGATVGLAFCPLDAREPAALLAAADAAMYAAKRAGKNCYRRAQGA
ncbi:MAG: diguanylate cyclase [Burkholderiaceae bacterium]|nr:diguanylate cyclase [Burkholderiaceae bacterium]